MPMWRCPHCGTPQAETARCWVCKRSSTACGTCRNFRRSVAGSLGYCGLDRRRRPLVGDEIQPCWEAWPGAADLVLVPPLAMRPADDAIAPARVGPREFVEVHDRPVDGPVMAPGATAGAAEDPAPLDPGAIRPLASPGAPGWSLWGDLDR